MIGRVYKIYVEGVDECYIGSTTQSLKKRFHTHRGKYKLYQKGSGKYTSSLIS